MSTSPQEELDALLDARLATQDPATRARIDAEIRARFLQVRAVLITDMSGFSRLTQEEGILHFLAMVRRMRGEVSTRIAAAGGRVVKFEADNVYAAFDHPDDALAAAIALLDFCADETERPPHEAIGLSIGLSWGDVLDLDGAEFFGDPVNLASKLGEDTAERNQALATEAFVDALAEHKGWLWEKHETRISGIKLPYFSLHRVR